MDKRFLAILAAVIIGLAGIFALTNQSNDGKSGNSGNSGAQPTSHISGQGQSGVTLMEYGDYQCPVCFAYHSTLNQVAQKYQKEIFFQFRNLPLVSIHQNAFAAARAAEAAGKQNKYWQMYNKLYENQSTWSSSSNALNFFKSYAKAIGLDGSQFEKDYASASINDAINADLDAFDKTGQPQATPTFFINGKYIANSEFSDSSTGAPSVEKFSTQIDKAIAEQKKTGS